MRYKPFFRGKILLDHFDGTDRRVSPVDLGHEGQNLLCLLRLPLAEQPRRRLRHPLVQHDGDEVGQSGDEEEGLPRRKYLCVINLNYLV